MPGPGVDPMTGVDSGTVSASSIAIVQDVLTTDAAALGAAGAAAQLFSTPSPFRTHVFIANNGSGAMYVGYTSDVSSTKHAYKVAANANTLLPLSPQVSVWVRPDGTGNNYTAHEMRIR